MVASTQVWSWSPVARVAAPGVIAIGATGLAGAVLDEPRLTAGGAGHSSVRPACCRECSHDRRRVLACPPPRPSPAPGRVGRPVTCGSARFEPGCSVVVYTDGLVEGRDEGFDDCIARWRRRCTDCDGDAEGTCDDLMRALFTECARDDVALVVVKPATARPVP